MKLIERFRNMLYKNTVLTTGNHKYKLIDVVLQEPIEGKLLFPVCMFDAKIRKHIIKACGGFNPDVLWGNYYHNNSLDIVLIIDEMIVLRIEFYVLTKLIPCNHKLVN